MIHTIYTMTIGRFAELMETGDINLVKRFNIWLPKKYLLKQYHNLIKSYNELTNEKGTDREKKRIINDGFDKINVSYQILTYDIMFKMVTIWYQLHGNDKKNLWNTICEFYKIKYNKIPKEEDLVRIAKDGKLLVEKAQQVFPEEKENKKYSFEDELRRIERILSPLTIRDKKLYLYPRYINDISELNKTTNNK